MSRKLLVASLCAITLFSFATHLHADTQTVSTTATTSLKIELFDYAGDLVAVPEDAVVGPAVFIFKETANSCDFWTLSDAKKLVLAIAKLNDQRVQLEDLTILSNYLQSLGATRRDVISPTKAHDDTIALFKRYSIAPHDLALLRHRWSIAVPTFIPENIVITTDSVSSWIADHTDVAVIDPTTGDILVNASCSTDDGQQLLAARRTGSATLPYLYIHATAQVLCPEADTQAGNSANPSANKKKNPPKKSPVIVATAATGGFGALKTFVSVVVVGGLIKAFSGTSSTQTPPAGSQPPAHSSSSVTVSGNGKAPTGPTTTASAIPPAPPFPPKSTPSGPQSRPQPSSSTGAFPRPLGSADAPHTATPPPAHTPGKPPVAPPPMTTFTPPVATRPTPGATSPSRRTPSPAPHTEPPVVAATGTAGTDTPATPVASADASTSPSPAPATPQPPRRSAFTRFKAVPGTQPSDTRHPRPQTPEPAFTKPDKTLSRSNSWPTLHFTTPKTRSDVDVLNKAFVAPSPSSPVLTAEEESQQPERTSDPFKPLFGDIEAAAPDDDFPSDEAQPGTRPAPSAPTKGSGSGRRRRKDSTAVGRTPDREPRLKERPFGLPDGHSLPSGSDHTLSCLDQAFSSDTASPKNPAVAALYADPMPTGPGGRPTAPLKSRGRARQHHRKATQQVIPPAAKSSADKEDPSDDQRLRITRQRRGHTPIFPAAETIGTNPPAQGCLCTETNHLDMRNAIPRFFDPYGPSPDLSPEEDPAHKALTDACLACLTPCPRYVACYYIFEDKMGHKHYFSWQDYRDLVQKIKTNALSSQSEDLDDVADANDFLIKKPTQDCEPSQPYNNTRVMTDLFGKYGITPKPCCYYDAQYFCVLKHFPELSTEQNLELE